MASFEFLGPYRIGELLGRGGMGSVFAAVHEKTGQEVAVKLIAEHVADEERFRSRFHRETETLLRLHHEGIVEIVGVGEEQGRLFYSMEMVHGEPLQKRIRRDKRMDWRVTLDITIQICAALKHAHDTGVFHRDLKPANLILEPDDKVKLVDFGISKLYGYGDQTAAGSVLGTADYMAPEQATGDAITARTDLYALGSVMYAMLTGRPPFTGKKITEVIESLKRDRPVPLDLVNPELPDELVELVHELLEKDPKDRPPTALVVANRLKAMRAGLEREQTLGDGQLPTEMGDDDFESNAAPHVSDAASAMTNVVGGATAGRPRTVVSKGAEVVKKVSAEDVTLVSGPGGQTLRPDGSVATEPDTETRKTHFQTVDVSHPSSGLFDAEEQPERNWIGQAVSITVMLAILVVCGILFVRATIPPTADELYAAIMDAKNAGVLPTAQSSIDQLLDDHPEDPRCPEVRALKHSLDLGRCLRRLTVQAKLGITPLTPAEEAFVEAMTGREQNPSKAMEDLRTWLEVYAESTTPMTKTEKVLESFVRTELELLVDRHPAIIIDPRAQTLIDRIHTSIEHDTPEKARDVLQGIKKLHDGKPWAEPAIKEADQQLKALDEFGSPAVEEEEAEPAARA